MLMDRFGDLDLHRALSACDFAPFPRAFDREGWAQAQPDTRRAWVGEAEKYADYAWPALPAAGFLHFHRTGENLPYLFALFERRGILGILALAECMEGRGRFLDQIVTGLWCVCEETVWMTPFDVAKDGQAMPAAEDRVVDLATSETGALLAWIWYLFGAELDRLSPRIGERIRAEVQYRLIEPYLKRDDYWWMGFVETPRVNNWNPWCNRNILMCALLVDIGESERQAVVRKAMRSLDEYLIKYPKDGCCDEGPMYWGAAGGGLHTCLTLLKAATGGAVDIFDEPIVRDIGAYFYKAHIHGDWFADFADGDAHVKPGAAAYHFGKSIGDTCLTALGASATPARPDIHNWFGAYEYLLDIFSERERKGSGLSAPYARDAWMGHTEVMFARENQGSPQGLYLAAKAGHNGEAHNHNDVGNFIVYADGCPVIVDLGTEEYSAKTFSPQRFELWYLQSQYHNCPAVSGVMQHDGKAFAARAVAYASDGTRAEMRADIAGAYPTEAGVERWLRTCRLNRGEDASVEIVDDYRLAAPASDVRWSLMTPLKPDPITPGELTLEYAPGRRVSVRYDGALDLTVDEIGFMESRLRKNWGDVMYRIVLREKGETAGATRRIVIQKS